MPIVVTQLRVQRPTTAYGSVEQIIAPVTTGRRALILQGLAGQTANLLEIQSSTAASLTAVTADGWLRLGPQMAGVQAFIPLSICGPYMNQFSGAQIQVMSNDPQAVDKGGSIVLGGARDDAGVSSSPWGRIAGGKTDSVAGDTAGYLNFWTRPTGGNMTERLRLTSAGGLEVRNGGTVLAAVDTTGNLDLKKHQLQNAVTHNLATAPASPVEGQRYYDTVSKLERVWDGTKWTDLATTSIAYLPLAGGTMTEGGNIAVGTVTGTKIGTSNLQRIGFWNATPVIQNTGWTVTAGYTADKAFNPTSTTLTETATVLGTLIDTLKSYGLLAT